MQNSQSNTVIFDQLVDLLNCVKKNDLQAISCKEAIRNLIVIAQEKTADVILQSQDSSSEALTAYRTFNEHDELEESEIQIVDEVELALDIELENSLNKHALANEFKKIVNERKKIETSLKQREIEIKYQTLSLAAHALDNRMPEGQERWQRLWTEENDKSVVQSVGRLAQLQGLVLDITLDLITKAIILVDAMSLLEEWQKNKGEVKRLAKELKKANEESKNRRLKAKGVTIANDKQKL